MSSCLNIVSCHTQHLMSNHFFHSIHERINILFSTKQYCTLPQIAEIPQTASITVHVCGFDFLTMKIIKPPTATHSPSFLRLFVTVRPLVEHFVYKLFNGDNQVAILKIILNGCRQTTQSFIHQLINESKL